MGISHEAYHIRFEPRMRGTTWKDPALQVVLRFKDGVKVPQRTKSFTLLPLPTTPGDGNLSKFTTEVARVFAGARDFANAELERAPAFANC